jgi:hypothetical protein
MSYSDLIGAIQGQIILSSVFTWFFPTSERWLKKKKRLKILYLTFFLRINHPHIVK